MKKLTMLIMATFFAMCGMAQTITLPYTQDFSDLTEDLLSMMGFSTQADASVLDGIASVAVANQAGGAILIGGALTIGSITTEDVNTAAYDSIRVTFRAVNVSPYPTMNPEAVPLAISYNSVLNTVVVNSTTHPVPLYSTDFGEYTTTFVIAAASTAVSIFTQTAGTIQRCAIDDLVITGFNIPSGSCPRPTGVGTTAIGVNTADITWTGGAAWNVIVSDTVVIDFAAVSPFTATVASYHAAGLNQGTRYYVYVQADCTTETSEWTTVVTFTTLCTAISTLPWTEYFGSYAVGSSPNCWIRVLEDEGSPRVNDMWTETAQRNIRFDATSNHLTQLIATPEFATDVSSMNVELHVLKNGQFGLSGTVELGVMSDVSEPNTFELIMDVTPPTNSYASFAASLSGAITPNCHYIAFRVNLTSIVPGFEYFAIDRVEVTGTGAIPPTVTTLPANNITATGATLRKTVTANTDPVDEQGFEYRVYGSTTSWTSTASTGNLTLTSLTANTRYEYRAYAIATAVTHYGLTLDFTTLYSGTPIVTTVAASLVGQTTATLNKTVVQCSENIDEQGFEYRVVNAASWIPVITTSNSSALAALTPNTDYEFRAYATTATAPHYGAIMSFTTLQEVPDGYNTANANEFLIYPNPANSIATVKVEGLRTSAKVTVTDIDGKLIETRTISAGNDKAEFNVANYVDGTYLVRVIADGMDRVEKLIVKKN
ncbi:MAG: T9SS type A sorting domain-containing protein [Prevotellaceae bacterium]|jgi:hypothetical protein|nr:T9SS type A sorting domain-containing protein [Prevotellaceae bacterium]